MRPILTAALFLTALATVVSAENWPAWRGPSGTSVSLDDGVPTQWSDSSNVAWKTPLRGMGVSSPVV
jgi:hypothetical protein